MKKFIYTAFASLSLLAASCSGTNQQGAGTDSPQNNNDTSNADTTMMHTDSSSTGLDNSSSGGTDAMKTDSAKK